MRIEIPLFPGFDDLDALGPFEVFRNAGWDAHLVGAEGPGPVTTSHGATLLTADGLGEQPGAVLVPGGGWADRSPEGAYAQAGRGTLVGWLRDVAPGCAWVASVCTGAPLLARAGLLDGRPAVTHQTALDELATMGPSEVLRDARVVDTGDVLTSGGVTAGLDLALWLVEREGGPELAARVAAEMELPRPSARELVVQSTSPTR